MSAGYLLTVDAVDRPELADAEVSPRVWMLGRPFTIAVTDSLGRVATANVALLMYPVPRLVRTYSLTAVLTDSIWPTEQTKALTISIRPEED